MRVKLTCLCVNWAYVSVVLSHLDQINILHLIILQGNCSGIFFSVLCLKIYNQYCCFAQKYLRENHWPKVFLIITFCMGWSLNVTSRGKLVLVQSNKHMLL